MATAPAPGVGEPTTLAEVLDLSEVDVRLIDFKIGLVRAIRVRRQARRMSQAALAKVLGVAQARVAELESSRPGTTTDTLLRAYFAVGGTGADLAAIALTTDESMNH